MKSQQLRIATWNLGRPTFATQAKNDSLLETLRTVDADILVLTETNSCIDPGEVYASFASTCLFQSLAIGAEEYQPGENRVTIWSRLPGRRRIDMCNSHSAVCAQITTDWGELNVYGTVIGIYGKNRSRFEPILSQTDFERTLEVQLADWERLAELGNLCIAGDFNLSFADDYYVSRRQRARILACFERLKINLRTGELLENVDHIAVSRVFFNPDDCSPEPWRGKSDHQGVWLTIKTP